MERDKAGDPEETATALLPLEADSCAAASAEGHEQPTHWPISRRVGLITSAVAVVVAVAALGRLTRSNSQLRWLDNSGPGLVLDAVPTGPTWGCGLVGSIPGISQQGQTTPETQRFIDALKVSSSLGKVTYWAWSLTNNQLAQPLSADFLFMPETWGAGPVQAQSLQKSGWRSPSETATILLGMNEPDIRGMCMTPGTAGCSAPCTPQAYEANDCPVPAQPVHDGVMPARLAAKCQSIGLVRAIPEKSHAVGGSGAHPGVNSRGQCRCGMASGVGFWSMAGCNLHSQPLPKLFHEPRDENCISKIMQDWRHTAAAATSMGYRYLSTPLIAGDVTYARHFIEEACGCTGPGKCRCTDGSCGCPAYVGFHFYAFDCRPKTTPGFGYADFRDKLDKVARIMEDYPFVEGAIINEVGMLNQAPPNATSDAQQYPAACFPDHACPQNEELPSGIVSFMDDLFDMVIKAKTKDGRSVVKGFSWFNEDQVGDTYNLQLFDNGKVNQVGKAYMRNCARWGHALKHGLEKVTFA
ncbi:unnamed protein product [Polarella glacialis]|uniref:Asl1-like glycosyl hydrolase catalytic domain-containing protein n=1 Tax=Polarella glacialis TaxID=89957 RepID=A0A813LSI2_POLGL|nr:unnamed protein product [Polarella glacialis]